ncbi:DMT family transporter [Azospirillum sp. sgz302134]
MATLDKSTAGARGATAFGTGGARVAALTAVAMLAFAANSVLCRSALAQTAIDPATFTLVRIVSGAATLGLLVLVTRKDRKLGGSWGGAAALLAYAAAFSFAYVSLSAGTGALLLFGAVQGTMIVAGLLHGERMAPAQWGGLLLASAGLVVLVAPGVSAPPPVASALMLAAGAAWGAYSLLGRRSGAPPLVTTAGNFLRASPLALVLALLLALPLSGSLNPDPAGLVYAVLSGALASGMGYAIWYAALPGLTAARAASVQLSVPAITAVGGALLLGESITLRLALASAAILGGIALVILGHRRRV